jgi:hypothetical protein
MGLALLAAGDPPHPRSVRWAAPRTSWQRRAGRGHALARNRRVEVRFDRRGARGR